MRGCEGIECIKHLLAAHHDCHVLQAGVSMCEVEERLFDDTFCDTHCNSHCYLQLALPTATHTANCNSHCHPASRFQHAGGGRPGDPPGAQQGGGNTFGNSNAFGNNSFGKPTLPISHPFVFTYLSDVFTCLKTNA